MDGEKELGDIDKRLRAVEADVTLLKSQVLDVRTDTRDIRVELKSLTSAVSENKTVAMQVLSSIGWIKWMIPAAIAGTTVIVELMTRAH